MRIVGLGDAPLDIIERLTVAPEPELVIRSREDDASAVLSAVRDVEVLPQGRVARPGRGSVRPAVVTQAPFGRRLHIASASDGVWIADDDRWEARKYSPGGVNDSGAAAVPL